MTNSNDTMPSNFSAWADDYIQRQYPFYNRNTALDVGCALKRQLQAAWEAGCASRLAEIETVEKALGKSRNAFRYIRHRDAMWLDDLTVNTALEAIDAALSILRQFNGGEA